jgi:hypothetical protein
VRHRCTLWLAQQTGLLTLGDCIFIDSSRHTSGGTPMRTYVCDWCNRAKKPGTRWILGFAAERVTSSGVQREISIEAMWSERRADHPLAEAHSNYYVAALFKDRKRTPVIRRSVSSPSPRAKRMQASTAPGAVSVETEYETELLPPIGGVAAKTHRKGSRTNNAKFGIADSIRSHGMGVRLNGRFTPNYRSET